MSAVSDTGRGVPARLPLAGRIAPLAIFAALVPQEDLAPR